MSPPLRVCLVERDEPGTTGTARYAAALGRALRDAGVVVGHAPTRPSGPLAAPLRLFRRAGPDLSAFLASYPLRLSWPAAHVYHLTTQTYASLLFAGAPPGPSVVTVHDIIPYLLRDDPALSHYRHPLHRLFDLLAMRGLRRADAIVADSHWTRGTLVRELRLPPDRITVVHLGIDHSRFRPQPVPAVFWERYGLAPETPFVLAVSSEDPRKNLHVLWRAFAQLRGRHAGLLLVKVGPRHTPRERARLTALAETLGVAPHVRLFEHVPENDLPLFYCAAAACAVPSRFEGFGLPVLEAMACGTPVACADTSSLPEVAGDAAVAFPHDSPGALAVALAGLLGGAGRQERIARGLERAAGFTWERTAAETLAVYHGLSA